MTAALNPTISTTWSQQNSLSYSTKGPSHSHNTRLHSTPKKSNSGSDERSGQSELISPFKSIIDNLPDGLLEPDPTNWGNVNAFEKGSNGRNLPFTKLTSPGATGLCNVNRCCLFIAIRQQKCHLET